VVSILKTIGSNGQFKGFCRFFTSGFSDNFTGNPKYTFLYYLISIQYINAGLINNAENYSHIRGFG
jgi:hypothetical protein